MKQVEFNLQKKLIELEGKNDKKKHEYHMKELEVQRLLELLKFNNKKQMQRIKNADIQRAQIRRDYSNG